MAIPVDDWQFWVATLAAAASGWLVLRNLFPGGPPWRRGRKGVRHKAVLTVEGKDLRSGAQARARSGGGSAGA